MTHTEITDDLDRLLAILPQEVQGALYKENNFHDLLEVVLDLGRIPEARFTNKVISLGSNCLTKNDLKFTISKLGEFSTDNRAGIEKTLHRISAIRNRQQEIVGLTCRVGRAIYGTVEMVRDLLDNSQSLLLLGRPGVGKTTALREIARVLADDLNKRVVIIDTSNEIAGDGDIPHPAIGHARRMQVAQPEYQHKVMIEAVENHMPEVIVIDEIGTELEAQAARTIAERGVQLIATAHGNSLANLIKNPTLCDLIGGIQSVTLGDEEARRRRTQKTVLERSCEPTFSIAVEINTRHFWSLYKDVASTVDSFLRGQKLNPQERELDENGSLKMRVKSNSNNETRISQNQAPQKSLQEVPTNKSKTAYKNKSFPSINNKNASTALNLFCCGIDSQLVHEVIRRHGWSIEWVTTVKEANAILSVRKELSHQKDIRSQAHTCHIPIMVIKSNTLPQIERALKRLLARHQGKAENVVAQIKTSAINQDDSREALEECRLALEKVVVPLGRPVELLPRSPKILEMQADLVRRYRLNCDIFLNSDKQQLRIYPP